MPRDATNPHAPPARDRLAPFAEEMLARRQARGLRRRVVETRVLDGARVERRGRVLINFSGNDYLGLARDPRVVAAACRAVAEHGAGAGASRLVTGSHPPLHRLEERLAAFKGREEAVVFGSGYLANLGTLTALVGAEDAILIDELAHSCLFAGARLTGARIEVFRHNDTDDLDRRLRLVRPGVRHAWIVTEGVFSMDGDRAPLAEIAGIARHHAAFLHLDDAHGTGVLADGRGSAAAAGIRPEVAMGTLSKALGAGGGFVAVGRSVAELVRNRAWGFVYTTGLPPAAAAAALAAIEIVEREPERCRRPLELARRFTRRLGLSDAQSAIVPLHIGDAHRAVAAQAALERAGFLVVAIRPPTVPAGTARLRVSFSAAHACEDVDALAEAIARAGIPVPSEGPQARKRR